MNETRTKITLQRAGGLGGRYRYGRLMIRRVHPTGLREPEWLVTVGEDWGDLVHRAPTLGRVREWLASSKAQELAHRD